MQWDLLEIDEKETEVNNCKQMWVPLVLLLASASAVSADSIKGKVTDDSGKPVCGAVVTATDTSKKTISGYSQKDGQYSITVPGGNYEVAVEAFGFSVRRDKKDTTRRENLNFVLSPLWDVTRLSGAELEQLVPNDAEGRLLKYTCQQCHDFATVVRRRGQTAEEWRNFLPNMAKGRAGGARQPVFSDAQLNALSKALGKYFGPDSVFSPDAAPPTRDQVRHAYISDVALSATITEWLIPNGADAFANSIRVDSKRGIAWFTEGAISTIGRFDIKAEKFTQFTSAPNPHTPAIAADGRAWVTLQNGMGQNATQPNLAVIDPDTNQITNYKYAGGRPHTPIVSRDGRVWLSGSPGIWMFDPETQQFKQYLFPLPARAPEYSLLSWEHVPGEPELKPEGFTYHLGEDSTGNIWGASYEMGMIVRLDPKTGETKEFFPPHTVNSRGMVVDQHDNVWMAAEYDHKLVKLDPKTGVFKMYQPPSQGSYPYGIVEDKKTGYIWFGDKTAYTLTRFDPKTERFVEYRLPGYPAIPRFIDVDSEDGKVWFTDFWNGKIGVLDPNGKSKQLASR